MSDLLDRCVDAIGKNSRGLSDHEIARDISAGARATWRRDARAVLDEVGGADTIERLTKELEGLRATIEASCEDERSQMWEASSSSGGCPRAIAAEAARDEARETIKDLECEINLRALGAQSRKAELSEALGALRGLVAITVNPYDRGEFEDGELPALDAARAVLAKNWSSRKEPGE